MPSIIIYISDGDHRPTPDDPDVCFVTDEQLIIPRITASNHTLPIVCLCRLDPMTIIGALPPNVIIFLCKCYSEDVNLPNVRKDVDFKNDEHWKLKVISYRTTQAEQYGNRQELLTDRQIVKDIIEENVDQLKAPVQIERQNQNQNQDQDQDVSSGASEGNDDAEENND